MKFGLAETSIPSSKCAGAIKFISLYKTNMSIGFNIDVCCNISEGTHERFSKTLVSILNLKDTTKSKKKLIIKKKLVRLMQKYDIV